MVGILIFVHYDIAVEVLIVGKDVRLLLEQTHGKRNNVVKIKSVRLFQLLLIQRINAADHL